MFLHSLNSEYELLKASNEKESKGKEQSSDTKKAHGKQEDISEKEREEDYWY